MTPLMLPFGALGASPKLYETSPALYLETSKHIFASYDGGDSVKFKSDISTVTASITSSRFSYLDGYWFLGGFKQFLYSNDLVNWTVVTLPSNIGNETVHGDVHYLPLVNKYMMIGSLTYFLSDVGSLDSWTQYSLPGAVQGSTVSTGFVSAHQKVFVAKSGQYSDIYYTEDGLTWNSSNAYVYYQGNYTFDYNTGRLIAFGETPGTASYTAGYSYTLDGVVWNQSSNFPSSSFYGSKSWASNESILVYADRGSGIYRSSDGGETWLSVARPIFNTNLSISFDSSTNRFVIVSGSSSSGDRRIFYSEDAITWTQSSVPAFTEYANLATRYSFN